MKKYNSQKEFEAKIKDGIFRSEESIDITSFNLDVEAKIEVAGNINAEVVSYYAVVFAYKNIKVKSIKGRRENSKHFVLDGKLEVEEK